MKITRISVHIVALDRNVVNTRYVSEDSLAVDLETTILRVETDTDLVGWGETCTAPSYYLPTLASGARAAIAHVVPLILGADPRRINWIMARIDTAMRGQGPAKSAIEMALWDLKGKAHGLPLVYLWGGPVAKDMAMMCVVDVGTPDQMLAETAHYRAQGYKFYQQKIGEGIAGDEIGRITTLMADKREDEIFWFDPNRAWTIAQGMAVLPRVVDLTPIIENPCETYEECKTLSKAMGLPMMLDEVLTGPDILRQAAKEGIIQSAVLKLSSTGGLRHHRQMLDVAQQHGLACRIEDFYGTGLTLAAVCHLAQSLPEAATFALYDFQNDDVPVVSNPFRMQNGRVSVPEDCGPGLGVSVDPHVIGAPVADYVL